MKIKHLVLIALTALALGLASGGVGAPAVAGGRVGGGGDIHAGVAVPAIASVRAGAGGNF
jgi:hypothetical protein